MNIPNGNYLVIEGNIGAGKTSLSKMLSEQLNARLILEEFSDNPFLPLFYKNPERYAFPVELFFMTERHKQLQELLLEGNLFQEYIVSDYIFSKTLLFAGQNLENEEFRLFQKLFHTLNASFPKPHLLVYIHRPVSQLLTNIKKRGRSYESDISSDYLQKIQAAYFDFFRMTEQELPILILELDDMDFIDESANYDLLLEQLNKKYEVGIHYWSPHQTAI